MGNIFNISNFIIYIMATYCQTCGKSEHSASCRTDILSVVIGTPTNVAKLHLFIGRCLGAVMVVIINTAYCLRFAAIGNGVCIVLCSKGYGSACCSRS